MNDRKYVPDHAANRPRPPAPKPNGLKLQTYSSGYNGHVPNRPRPAPPQPSPSKK